MCVARVAVGVVLLSALLLCIFLRCWTSWVCVTSFKKCNAAGCWNIILRVVADSGGGGGDDDDDDDDDDYVCKRKVKKNEKKFT
jgi:hypothetical protein